MGCNKEKEITMANSFIFSWAENADGKMVHVDSVPNGLQCKCICPHCREQLLARHGQINEHGFAHHSDKRGANLNICYMVILYKLAEHILQTKKRIHVPSYYGIYKETDIEFVDVKVDSEYEREDKQPDVIARTKDNQQYLIEFTFQYKVQHKKDLDYHNLNCLEIDLSGQTLESLEDFLMLSSENRRWINNENYFNRIEKTYHNANKAVRVISESNCRNCKIKNFCCAIKQNYHPIRIENNGQTFRICKIEEYNRLSEALKQQSLHYEQQRKNEEYRIQNLKHKTFRQDEQSITIKENDHIHIKNTNHSETEQKTIISTITKDSYERSCFDCELNLTWANKGGMANCGCYSRLGIKPAIKPDYAKNCRMFKRKHK